MKHLEVFYMVKNKFMLETDASLKGQGTILCQYGIHVIVHVSQSFYPHERSMHNYSSAKLEWLALKWEVMKVCNYLLGLQFQASMDNEPLTYIQESKLGASQIWWLSELALFNFMIKYWTGHSNMATVALSCHQFNPDSESECETDGNEVEGMSYSSVCEAVAYFSKVPKYRMDLKLRHRTWAH